MSLLIGIDEAGYGPNLGPLLLAATVWETARAPAEVDGYAAFRGVIRRADEPNRGELLIADSKQVYNPARGLADLEAGVLTAIATLTKSVGAAELDTPAAVPQSFLHFVERFHLGPAVDFTQDPWFTEDLPLPVELPVRPPEPAGTWRGAQRSAGICLRRIAIDLVLPARFNELNRNSGSKGRTLSQLSLQLLRNCLAAEEALSGVPTLILADKHGGRQRYQEFLPIVCDEAFITCLEETPRISRYRAGDIEFRFQMQAERHLPTAVASMTAKYVRELAMRLFNRFWAGQVPGLKPTAGYPVDAARFRREIVDRQRKLAIPDEILWRDR